MRHSTYLILLAAAMPLAACDPKMDMQGVDPVDYYAAHPIENKVETRTQTYQMYFAPRHARLTREQVAALHATLRDVSPAAAESVTVDISENDIYNRRQHDSFVKELSRMGFDPRKITFGVLPATEGHKLRIEVRTAVVVPPADCPDWRTSPVTTYSNTMQGNFKCSQVVNLGLMVADPHDLVKGTGDVTPDAMRDSAAVHAYRTGTQAPSSPAGSTGGNGYETNNIAPMMGIPMNGQAGIAP